MAKSTKTTKAAKAPRLPHSATKLTDAAGNRLTIVAQQLNGGQARTAVLHRVDGKTSRGMVSTHESFDAAQRVAEALVGKAKEAGWTAKAGKAPAFTAIPQPVNGFKGTVAREARAAH